MYITSKIHEEFLETIVIIIIVFIRKTDRYKNEVMTPIATAVQNKMQ